MKTAENWSGSNAMSVRKLVAREDYMDPEDTCGVRMGAVGYRGRVAATAEGIA